MSEVRNHPQRRSLARDIRPWSGDLARRVVFLIFLSACFLLGGGARADIVSLLLLRPLSFLVAGYALLTMPRSAGASALRMPLILLLALCALLVLQIVPLPHSLWSQLPGRELVARVGGDVGLKDDWRPLSLSPSRTLNSLFAMGVPLAMALLVIGLDPARRDLVVWALLGAGALSALLGLIQITGPAHSVLYTYRIANFGTPAGLFANRNHQAAFLASLIPLLAYQLLRIRGKSHDRRRPLLMTVLIGGSVLGFALILATGSRTGTVLALVATVASAALWYLSERQSAGFAKSSLRRLNLPLAVCGLAAVAALMFVNSRTPGVDRLFNSSLADEMRARVLPVLWNLAVQYFPAGTGFGSFYLVYEVAEPHALLQTHYLNQAHNDLLQVLIEGGLAGAVLLAGALIWFALSGWRCWRDFAAAVTQDRRKVGPGMFAWVSLAVLLSASLTDYPMRSPALMAVAVILVVFISSSTGASKKSLAPEITADRLP